MKKIIVALLFVQGTFAMELPEPALTDSRTVEEFLAFLTPSPPLNGNEQEEQAGSTPCPKKIEITLSNNAHSRMKFECPDCKQIYYSKKGYEIHRRRSHPDSLRWHLNEPVKIASTTSPELQVKIAALSSVANLGPFECLYCKKIYSSKQNYDAHFKRSRRHNLRWHLNSAE
jgi:hypothetical protein